MRWKIWGMKWLMDLIILKIRKLKIFQVYSLATTSLVMSQA